MAKEIADSTLLDTWASSGLIVEPDISKIIEGWQLGEQPPHEYMNWLQNTFGSKLNHILKNGVVKWNDETEYLSGSSVQHNGNIWLCKTTNTNSAPTDANANWKRIITVESLTTVLSGYVENSGNETIAGVKTFTSSPIVPTPTTGTQAANKDYVDNVATLNINDLTDKPTPSDTDNLAIQETGGLLKKLSWANLKNTIKDYLSVDTGFIISLTENGYIKFPSWLGGLLIQWGGTIVGENVPTTITYPIVMPNATLVVIPALNRDYGNQGQEAISAYSYTKNNFVIKAGVGTVGVDVNVKWFAIGY